MSRDLRARVSAGQGAVEFRPNLGTNSKTLFCSHLPLREGLPFSNEFGAAVPSDGASNDEQFQSPVESDDAAERVLVERKEP